MCACVLWCAHNCRCVFRPVLRVFCADLLTDRLRHSFKGLSFGRAQTNEMAAFPLTAYNLVSLLSSPSLTAAHPSVLEQTFTQASGLK